MNAATAGKKRKRAPPARYEAGDACEALDDSETDGVDNDGLLRTPAYGIVDTTHNQGCSGHSGRFCFFCEYMPNVEATTDPASTLRALVHEMMETQCELPLIVQKLRIAYESDVREQVMWESPKDGQMVEGPDWTADAIQCHLVHSSEFKSLFTDVVDKCFQSIILRQNNNMFSGTDASSLPDPDTHEQFLATIKTYIQFKRSIRST